MDLTLAQTRITTSPLTSKIFLSGPAGCGKTTTGVERMVHLLKINIPADSILVLTPQRTLQKPYQQILLQLRQPGGEVTLATVGGLARRMVDLFWPLAAEAAGFAHPDQPPSFLTLETSQYYMAHIVRPLLEEGYFESITIGRNRLYSQIIDNLNKSAAVGFDYREIGERLTAAWFGDPAQRRVYANAQDCATRFRQYCLAHNLLDFSLQLEVFWNILWPDDNVRSYLLRSYRHLIYDNVEEDIPRSHDLIGQWIPELESTLLIYDEGGGHRQFLGADPETGWQLRDMCESQVILDESLVNSETIARMERNLSRAILPDINNGMGNRIGDELAILNSRFYPELLDHITSEVEYLITEEGLPPSEIVILAPYLSDSLRFSLTDRLKAHNIPWRSHRPSRSLRDEPASHALLTLAALAHPQWMIHPPRFDVGYAFMQAIDGLDLVRAQLLTEIVYRILDVSLAPFDGIKADVQERITYTLGNRYSLLRSWLMDYQGNKPLPLDHFLRKLFGEVLSQPGFGFHSNFDSVRVAASLVESVQKFRQSTKDTFCVDEIDLGLEYVAMLQDGVIAAQYLDSWRVEESEAVLVAPAHTFIMMNRPVSTQFWLDAGSSGWSERLFQPLTHPYVLSRHWERERIWTDADEVEKTGQALARLVSGLLMRCRNKIYLCLSDLGESGFEQHGALLRAFQKVLQNANTDERR